MYGEGLDSRSLRYAPNASVHSAVNARAGTTW